MVVVETIDARNADILHRELLNLWDDGLPMLYCQRMTWSIED